MDPCDSFDPHKRKEGVKLSYFRNSGRKPDSGGHLNRFSPWSFMVKRFMDVHRTPSTGMSRSVAVTVPEDRFYVLYLARNPPISG